jgi:ComF family protein
MPADWPVPSPATSWLRRLTDGAVDLVLPRRCVHCGRPGDWLCQSCAGQLTPLDGPRCIRCGRPTPLPVLHCLECEGRALGFATAAAAFAYDGPARELVTACKFRGLRSLAAEMAELATPRFREVLAGAAAHGCAREAVVWAPTTHERRVERGFDHAELFARELAARAGLPVIAALQRTRGAGHQSRLGRSGRAANVAGAFCVHGAAIETNLKRVIVIDDVYTTGETLHQCALAFAGVAYDVHAFTFARTVRGQRC